MNVGSPVRLLEINQISNKGSLGSGGTVEMVRSEWILGIFEHSTKRISEDSM